MLNLNELFNILIRDIKIVLLAGLPIIELRGAIPIGISLGLSPLRATIVSFIGSMILVPFILLV